MFLWCPALRATIPSDQHSETVSDRYASKGLEALWELLKLYCHILYPVVLVSLWMFAMFAFFSYMVPKVFCKSTVISSQVCTASTCQGTVQRHCLGCAERIPCGCGTSGGSKLAQDFTPRLC